MSKKELERRTMRSDTSLKLTYYLARSPLPVAALPSMSLFPQLHSLIHTYDPTEVRKDTTRRTMKTSILLTSGSFFFSDPSPFYPSKAIAHDCGNSPRLQS